MKIKKINKDKFDIKKGTILPLGTNKVGKGVNFAVSVPNIDKCKLNIYAKGKEEKITSIILDDNYRVGSIFSVFIDNFDYRKYEYTYDIMDKEYVDMYANKINGREVWAKPLTRDEKKLVRGGFNFDIFNWGRDSRLNIPYSDSIMYRAHIRGLTCGRNSKVVNKGTFAGVLEKIPYLKELGITTLVLAPIYEFDEILVDKYTVTSKDPIYMDYKEVYEKQKKYTDAPIMEHYIYNKELDGVVPYKVNYWGYSDSCYFLSPKSSYASNPDKAANEVKEMVKQLHKAGIEVILEFFFAENTNRQLIIDCLRYWLIEYHIDGFKINNNVAPSVMIATDPVLCDTKFLTESWNLGAIYSEEFCPTDRKLAEINDGFANDIRKFLKGDEDQINKFAYRFRRNDKKNAVINYITSYNGFTLNDLYSYDVKHNEDNGEMNRDGNNYNYSWNCGTEGKTRKKKVMQLRKKMMKNAFLTMMLSQGTPMILSGDELCNTQEGNNNAYCQDNEVSWINWTMNTTNKDMFNFVKRIIKIRKEHPILHLDKQFRMMDYISCGYPDMSYHGTKAWYPDFSNYSRVIGILISGDYPVVKTTRNTKKISSKKTKDNYFYFAYNMHWESHVFELPKLPNGYVWKILVDTSDEGILDYNEYDSFYSHKNKDIGKCLTVNDRSIVVLISSKVDTKEEKESIEVNLENNKNKIDIRVNIDKASNKMKNSKEILQEK